MTYLLNLICIHALTLESLYVTAAILSFMYMKTNIQDGGVCDDIILSETDMCKNVDTYQQSYVLIAVGAGVSILQLFLSKIFVPGKCLAFFVLFLSGASILLTSIGAGFQAILLREPGVNDTIDVQIQTVILWTAPILQRLLLVVVAWPKIVAVIKGTSPFGERYQPLLK